MKHLFALEQLFVNHRVVLLRIAIGIVYFWFGILKIFDVSPVEEMIREAYWFMPYEQFRYLLGAWEMIIGLAFLFNIKVRYAVYLLWLQMAGIWTSLILNPSMFFKDTILVLSLEGEFAVKNLVTLASSLFFLDPHEKRQI